MNKSTIAIIFIVLFTWLTVQLGDIYGSSTIEQHCEMAHTSMPFNQGHFSDKSAHKKPLSNAAQHAELASKNCCSDMDLTTSCCDTECQCDSLVSTSAYLHTHSLSYANTSASKPSVMFRQVPLTPFLHPLNRPPISILS